MRGDVEEDSVKKGDDVELRRAGGARNAGRQGPIPNFDISIYQGRQGIKGSVRPIPTYSRARVQK